MLPGIAKFLLDYLLGKLFDFLKGVAARLQRHKQIDKEAEESKKPLEKAKTEKEIDESAKDILGGL